MIIKKAGYMPPRDVLIDNKYMCWLIRICIVPPTLSNSIPSGGSIVIHPSILPSSLFSHLFASAAISLSIWHIVECCFCRISILHYNAATRLESPIANAPLRTAPLRVCLVVGIHSHVTFHPPVYIDRRHHITYIDRFALHFNVLFPFGYLRLLHFCSL